MTRKRFVKKLMAMGVSRNEAEEEAARGRSDRTHRAKWSYAEHYQRAEGWIRLEMAMRSLSKASASFGTQMARAAEAFRAVGAAMGSAMEDVAARISRRVDQGGTAQV